MALFNQAVGWLRRNRVLLPGVSVLAWQVAEVRGTTEHRLYATVAKAARRTDASLPADLVALLDVPEGRRISELERLRRPPTRTTGTGMAKALERVDEISSFRLGRVRIDKVPPNRLSALARTGLGSKAPNLARHSRSRLALAVTDLARPLTVRSHGRTPGRPWPNAYPLLLRPGPDVHAPPWPALATDLSPACRRTRRACRGHPRTPARTHPRRRPGQPAPPRHPATTTETADRVGISLPSASQHTSVLRNAGLITTTRTGTAVLHTLTPLGTALLQGDTTTP